MVLVYLTCFGFFFLPFCFLLFSLHGKGIKRFYVKKCADPRGVMEQVLTVVCAYIPNNRGCPIRELYGPIGVPVMFEALVCKTLNSHL